MCNIVLSACHTNKKKLKSIETRCISEKKGVTYQPLSHTDDVTKVLDGWPEPFLHVAAKEHCGGRREVPQGGDLQEWKKQRQYHGTESMATMTSIYPLTLSHVPLPEKRSAVFSCQI